MPSIDEEAKAFELALAERFGRAVKTRRLALKLTASALSRRTAELGYPITRGAIARIESNSRLGKVDVAELFALAVALDIPPALLLFDRFPSAQPVEVLPGYQTPMGEAMQWLCGKTHHPRRAVRETIEGAGQVPSWRLTGSPVDLLPNGGVQLIKSSSSLETAIEDRLFLVSLLDQARKGDGDVDTAQASLDLHDDRIEKLRRGIVEARIELWGAHPERVNADESQNESDD